MEDKRWDDLSNFKTCPLCGTEAALFVDILEEHNKEAEQLAALQAENERMRSWLQEFRPGKGIYSGPYIICPDCNRDWYACKCIWVNE